MALELFTEQGYEATSLREIAERLGVTKAALYYHFKTKEDIVGSLVQDRIAALEAMIEWAGAQPPGPRLRREFLERYAEELQQGRHHELIRFFERNQTALRDHPKSAQMRDCTFRVIDLLTAPDESVVMRLKASMALLTLHATWFVLQDPAITDGQRKDASLQVALELIETAAPAPAGTGQA
ncbi:TetR/AcrR family transcriptional regulator [Rugosimonospora acidiphila]|uniref:TetR/AcrR family transcriptional regulator n=1 Tax=Rugosimonospora acidiphila TaxID=556531 RepID=UPI0031E9ED5E